MTDTHGVQRSSGVIAAALTPMGRDLAADTGLLQAHCEWLLAAGCSAVVVLGTTGEANSFTLLEREIILARLLEAGAAASMLIVGTGCCAWADTVRLTKHALQLGAHRALMLPPFYYKHVSDDGVFEAFARTIEAVADSRLRVYLYQIPQNSGVEFSFDLIERLLSAYPGIVAGIKDSAGDWSTTKALCERFGNRMDVLVGSERFLLPALAAGAAGCVTATANVSAPMIAHLYARRGDPASAELQSAVTDFRAAIESFPMIPALKEMVARHSRDGRWRNVRPPLRRLPAESVEQLWRRLAGAKRAVSMPRSGP